MTAIVLDASVVLKWFLPEAASETAIRLRDLDVACRLPTCCCWRSPMRSGSTPTRASGHAKLTH